MCKLAKASMRQLQWWDERGVISPLRHGYRRVYRYPDVIGMMVVAELRRKGFSLQKIRRMLRSVRREIERRLVDLRSDTSELYILTDGKSAYVEDRPDKIIDRLKRSRRPLSLVSVGEYAKRAAEFQEVERNRKRSRQADSQLRLF